MAGDPALGSHRRRFVCAYAYGPNEHPADLILDLDSTDDPTHGTQQLALFHGFYDQHMYHPLVWFEGRTGLLLRSRLRPGRDPSAACVVNELRHILRPLRRRFPHTPMFLRGDAGMATPAVEAQLEAEAVYYVLGIGTNLPRPRSNREDSRGRWKTTEMLQLGDSSEFERRVRRNTFQCATPTPSPHA